MGGYVSIAASQTLKPQGLFLLAPAVYMSPYANPETTPYASLTVAVHAWQDDVVPVGNMIRFAERHGAQLHLVNSDHRLISALPLIEQLFGWFLDRVLGGES